jgi:histidinol-phosphate aminotransferase
MSIKVKDELIGLTPYKPGKSTGELKRELGLDKIVKLASNENPFGCSPKAEMALKNSASELAIYPDGYALELRQELASFLGVDMKQIMFGAGSDELILMLCRGLLTPGANTVTATPTFPQFRHNAVIEGIEVRQVENIDGHHDLDGMLKQIDDQTRIVWVCTPNNPTGVYVNREKLYSFIKQVPDHVLVVVDEAYSEYVTKVDYPDVISWLDEFENLLVLRTFSKAYGLAALRIGYAIGHVDLIQALDPVRPPFNVSRVAQKAAVAALQDQQFINMVRQENEKGLQQYYQFCIKYNLKYFPSQGNFILIDFDRPGNEVFDYLLKRGFIVRSGEALGYPSSCRITVGNQAQNKEIIDVLSAWLDQQ